MLDIRVPDTYLPRNDKGEIVGGFRKVNFKDKPSMEASFGYGYTDYIVDENPNDIRMNDTDTAIIDLTYPAGKREHSIGLTLKDASGRMIEGASVYVDGILRSFSDFNGASIISNLLPGYHQVEVLKSGHSVSTLLYIERTEASKHIDLTMDVSPPVLSILSPEDETYSADDVSLIFTVNEATSWIGYSLDGQTNVTITGNTTLSDLTDGQHVLIVYAKDAIGNTGASKIVYFNIETHESYEELLEKYNSLRFELSNFQNWAYLSTLTAIVFVATTAYFLLRKPKAKAC